MHEKIFLNLFVSRGLFFSCFFILLGSGLEARAALSISPAYVQENLDRGRPAGQFIISNIGEKEERYRIRAIHFTFLIDGGVRRIPPDEHSLATWIKFNPTEFILAPKTRRAIRYTIIPRGKLQTGEYWGAMELESLHTTTASGKDEVGREYQIEVIPSLLVPIFGTFGKVRYQGLLKEVTLVPRETGGQAIRCLIGNTGEGRLLLEGEYRISNGAGDVVVKGSLGKFYLLPGLEQISSGTLPSDLAEGNYTVRVECRSPQLPEPLAKEFQVAWKPPL